MPAATSIAAAAALMVSVTNHAGAVLTGELTAVTNGTFTVSGRTYSLTILPDSEQKRLKELAGQDVRTAGELQIAKRLDYELRRIDARLAAGEITAEKAEELRRDARASAEWQAEKGPSAGKGELTK